jgi:hypothetical protein
MNKKSYPYMELDLNVVPSELVIINLYILLKYFSDIRFAGDFIIIKKPMGCGSKTDPSCHNCMP